MPLFAVGDFSICLRVSRKSYRGLTVTMVNHGIHQTATLAILESNVEMKQVLQIRGIMDHAWICPLIVKNMVMMMERTLIQQLRTLISTVSETEAVLVSYLHPVEYETSKQIIPILVNKSYSNFSIIFQASQTSSHNMP